MKDSNYGHGKSGGKGVTHGGEAEPKTNSRMEHGSSSRDEPRNREMENRMRDSVKGSHLSSD